VANISRKRDLDRIHDVNMTPLIDVSLVLVVILMVAMPLAFQSSIAVRQASASGRKAQVESKAERIEIEIRDNDLLVVNRTGVPRELLAEHLGPLLAQSSTRRVIVRCAPGVVHGVFVGVLDEAKQLGAGEIAVVGP
jgi:biopolymer transport protein ExbD